MTLNLVITVDTEEGFDWYKPFSRTGYSTMSLFEHDFHMSGFYKSYNIRPLSLISYPLLNDIDNQRLLKKHAKSKIYNFGTHLHSWVTPPFDEELSDFNSFAHNLPADLEFKKLKTLTEKFHEVFGQAPLFYKAGRYGVSQRSFEFLENLGYRFDFSPYALRDFSEKFGPNFSHLGNEPYYPLDQESDLLTVPATADYIGYLSPKLWVRKLYNHSLLSRLKFKSFCSQLGLINFIPLSPELSSEKEMQDLTRELIYRGQKLFHLSYHSSSFSVGGNPYAKTQKDIYLLAERLKNYLHFFQDIGGSFDVLHILNQFPRKIEKTVKK